MSRLPRRKIERATLYDVAKQAGVGTATVSRVINGGHRVDPKTLQRVQEVIQRLGYQPSQAARSLKGNSTGTIGLIVPTITDPFFATLASAAQGIARRNGYALILLTSDDDVRFEIEELQIFERHRIDGLIIVPPRSNIRSVTDYFNKTGIPVVSIDRPMETPDVSSVLCDNYQSSELAVEHLISHGSRRIVCLGDDPHLFTMKERLRGYMAAVEKARLPALWSLHAPSYEATGRILAEHLQRKGGMDAVFTLKSPCTVHVFEVLRRLNLKIPNRVRLLGFDDFPLATSLQPPISVIKQPVEEMGKAAAVLLFDQLAGRSAATQHIKIQSSLIVRESCGCAPAQKAPSPLDWRIAQ
jgi:LacI family transcriptional regulator